jgi:hypothetical protein
MAKNIEYKVLVGLDYPPANRAEIGDIVSDLPKESIGWLVSGGHIVLNSAAPAVEAVEAVVAEVVASLENELPLEEVVIDGE